MQYPRSIKGVAVLVIIAVGICGCHTDGDSGLSLSSDASLLMLDISHGQLDQVFQSNQFDYTAAAGFLLTSVSVTATTTDNGATVRINGIAVSTGVGSPFLPLSEGANSIDITVTAEDQITSQTYNLTVTRAIPASVSQHAFLKAGNTQADDLFGWSVAIDGNTLLVGAINHDSGAGAAYVFTRGSSAWIEQAFLQGSNTEAGDNFGASVAIDGDTVVVGAFGEDSDAAGGETDNSTIDAGAAYVFTRSGTVWSQQAMLKAGNAGAGDAFGNSLTIEGDTVVVGALGEDSSALGGEADNSANDAGAAYVFIRSGTTWSQQAMLKASNAETGDSFGDSVAVSGNTVAVGAYGEDSSMTGGVTDNSVIGAGAAYVFTRSGDAWSQQAILKASNGETGDSFGDSVAVSGNTVVVGAIGEDSSAAGGEADNSASDAGAAYVFTRNGNTWSQQAFLKASDAEAENALGWSVALAGNTVVAGAHFANDLAGAAYIFTRNDTSWTQQATLTARNANPFDLFAASVALEGDTAIIGAAMEDSRAGGTEIDNAANSAGAVYVWR